MIPAVAGESASFFRTRYGIDDAVMRRLLDRALDTGGAYADLYFQHSTGKGISFEEGAVRTTSSGASQGVGIRVISGKATGFAYTEDLTLESMLKTATMAAHICDRVGFVRSPHLTTVEPRNLYSIDRVPVGVPAADKVALIKRADAAARAVDSSVSHVMISYADSLKRMLVVTSEGRCASDEQPMLTLSVRCVSEKGGQKQGGSSSRSGRVDLGYFDRITPELIGREAGALAVLQHGAVDAPAGSFPVVLAPGDSGVLLHEAVGHGLEADFNRKGTSNYAGRIGERVASPLCTVVDDGTLPYRRGTVNVDDEGHPSQRNVLIERGMLRGYMHDWMSARHYGLTPSGNGRRESYAAYPMPRMTNTFMLAGEDVPEDIIRSVAFGIYCVRFSGGQVNISNGDFVFTTTEAYLIEEGRITTPIKTVNLIGNGPDTLTKVTRVGNDACISEGGWTCGKNGQSAAVTVGLPTTLISEMTVGGTRVVRP